MPATTTILNRRTVASAAAVATPAALMAASGGLSGAAIPVAVLLGVVLLAFVWYLASAWALVEEPERTDVVRRGVAVPAATGAC
jgi:hypothetical protein